LSDDADPEPMICAGNNRRMQVRRKPRRKIFGKRAKENFLEALSCTGNVTAAAEAAGVVPGTAYNHRRKDPEFRQAFWLALEQSVAKLVALRVQREIERAERAERGQLYTTVPGDERGQPDRAVPAQEDALALRLDGPPDERQIVDLVKLMAMLRDLCRNLSAEPGSAPTRPGSNGLRAASAEEIVASLEKRLKAFAKRREAEALGRGPPTSLGTDEGGDAEAA
jgi:hypothetical protein